MSNDKHVQKYLEPIITSRKCHSMMFDAKYKISIPNPNKEQGGQVQREVIDIDDVNSIIVTAQIEATVAFIETLLEDDNNVLVDDLENEFKDYVTTMRAAMITKV